MGRIDAVIDTEDVVYIFEFKLYDSKEDALQQNKEMHYAQKFEGRDRVIHQVGVKFRGRSPNRRPELHTMKSSRSPRLKDFRRWPNSCSGPRLSGSGPT